MPKKPHDPIDDTTDSSEDQPTELLDQPSYEALQRKLDETEQKTNQYWERILRMQADAENAQRRTEREVASAHKYALEKFVSELLPIVDSLELCINNETKEKESISSVVEGVEMTLKMFYTAFQKFGVQQINPVAEPFDPEFQQAISVKEDVNAEPGTVISVLQKGYTLNNRLIRPALVVVAKANN